MSGEPVRPSIEVQPLVGDVEAVVLRARTVVGRTGTPPLRIDDIYSHGVAFELEPSPVGWSVTVPDRGDRADRAREVSVEIQGQRVWTGRSAASWSGSHRHGIVVVRTILDDHAFAVTWRGRSRFGLADFGTIDPAEMAIVDLSRRSHRAVVIACAARIADPRHGALTIRQVAAEMAGNEGTVKKLLQRGRGSLAGWMDADTVTLDRLVDWLVATGAVDVGDLEAARAREALDATERRGDQQTKGA